MNNNHVIITCKACKEDFEVPFWKSKGHTTRCPNCRQNHKQTNTRLYQIWENMKQRCYNPNNTSYALYGGLGIIIQEDWKNDFTKFHIWAHENGYREHLTIDRKDGSKGYFSDNCRWVTQTIQSRNVKQVSKNNSTGYKGVFIKKDGRKKKFSSKITVNYKEINLGNYYSITEAAQAYNNYVVANNLEHTLNIIEEPIDDLLH